MTRIALFAAFACFLVAAPLPSNADLRDNLLIEERNRKMNNDCINRLMQESSFNTDSYAYYKVVGDQIYTVYILSDLNYCAEKWKYVATMGVQYTKDGYTRVWHREEGDICIYMQRFGESKVGRSCYKLRKYR
jgi:hypothetical protein